MQHLKKQLVSCMDSPHYLQKAPSTLPQIDRFLFTAYRAKNGHFNYQERTYGHLNFSTFITRFIKLTIRTISVHPTMAKLIIINRRVSISEFYRPLCHYYPEKYQMQTSVTIKINRDNWWRDTEISVIIIDTVKRFSDPRDHGRFTTRCDSMAATMTMRRLVLFRPNINYGTPRGQ